MTQPRFVRSVHAFAPLAACILHCSIASAQVYNDGHGKEWRQLTGTINFTWNQVAQVCPTDGQSACEGSIGSNNFTGWTWATPEQVALLYSYFAPAILKTPCIGGPEYTAAGIYFLGGGYITPTFAYYSTFGASLYVAGWTASNNQDSPGGIASAQYPVFDGSFCITGSADPATASPYTGVWLWREVAPACPGNINADNAVNIDDLLSVINAWGPCP